MCSHYPVVYPCGRAAIPSAYPGHQGGVPAARNHRPPASVQEAFPEARRSIRSQARDHIRAFPHRAHHRGGGEVHSLRGLLQGRRPDPAHRVKPCSNPDCKYEERIFGTTAGYSRMSAGSSSPLSNASTPRRPKGRSGRQWSWLPSGIFDLPDQRRVFAIQPPFPLPGVGGRV